VTLLSFDSPEIETQHSPEPCAAAHPEEKAGYGNCIVCGCGAYSDDGTGDCRCGHSYGQHYS
jgi:hypothetical protein